MDIHRFFSRPFWVAIFGVGGLIGLLVLAGHVGDAANLVRAAGLIWFILFAGLAFGAPERRGQRRFVRRA